MKPQKAEIDALTAVLNTPLEDFLTNRERETSKDPEALAQRRMFTKAIEAVDEARGQRTMWITVLRHGTVSVSYTSYGPYATANQAAKETEKLLAGMEATAYAVVPFRNDHGVNAIWQAADAPPEAKGMWAEVKRDQEALRNGWKGKSNTRHKFLKE